MLGYLRDEGDEEEEGDVISSSRVSLGLHALHATAKCVRQTGRDNLIPPRRQRTWNTEIMDWQEKGRETWAYRNQSRIYRRYAQKIGVGSWDDDE